MRRSLSALVAVGIAASLPAVARPAGAQSGDLVAMCQARTDANQAETPKENLATMDRAVAAAPADALPLITAVRDGFKKKGERFFETPAGIRALSAFDAYVYERCPGTKVPVTAIDYEFDGVPAMLAAGPTKFRLTNDAPREPHEMAIFKLLPAGESMDPVDILSMPEKKVGELVDFSKSAFMFAPPGASGYAPVDLEPGTYLYACFLPVGGKKKGAPHFTEGMYGTFTVQ